MQITTTDDGSVMTQTIIFSSGHKGILFCAIGRYSKWPVKSWRIPNDFADKERNDFHIGVMK